MDSAYNLIRHLLPRDDSPWSPPAYSGRCRPSYQMYALLALTQLSIFSFLPPSTTIRRYQRASLATSSAELGVIYCSIVSHANSSIRGDESTQRIVQSLIAIRSKLKRSLVLRTNVIYEASVQSGKLDRMLTAFLVLIAREMACKTVRRLP